MKNTENTYNAGIITLKTLRDRHFYRVLAHVDEHSQQTTASFNLEGLHATEYDAKRAACVIAGVWTLEQAIADVRRTYLASH